MSGCQALGTGCDYEGVERERFVVMDQFCIVIVVVVTQIFTCDKIS